MHLCNPRLKAAGHASQPVMRRATPRAAMVR